MRISKVILAFATTTLLMVGCANQKEPATNAVASIEASLAEVRDDAAKYAPTELQDVESTLAKLKAKLAKEDYKDVLGETQPLNAAVNTLKETVVSKKTQIAAATNEWTDLSTDVPKMVAAIQSRVDVLSKSRKLPTNLTKENFDAAKSGLETMKATWAEATAAFDAGNAMEASDKGRAVKAKGEEVLKLLGMSDGG
jgi:chromosome segregation ATPase